jgi:hypothetical protein
MRFGMHYNAQKKMNRKKLAILGSNTIRQENDTNLLGLHRFFKKKTDFYFKLIWQYHSICPHNYSTKINP